MAEQSTVSDPRAHDLALRLSRQSHDDWMTTLLTAMNPNKLSQTDEEMIQTYIARHRVPGVPEEGEQHEQPRAKCKLTRVIELHPEPPSEDPPPAA